jgi:hypothetical protein
MPTCPLMFLFMCANAMCSGRAFLDRLTTLVAPRGLVVLISPYSWLEGYTSKDKWVGTSVILCQQ